MSIEAEMKNNSIDDPSMMELLNNNKDLLGNISKKKIFPSRNKETFMPKSSTIANKKSTPSINILDNAPEATVEGLALYIATLSQSFINREIKKTILNAKLLNIINDDELVDILEMIGVVNSKTTENAFDLLLGINGYLFKFYTLFNNKESFAAKQKKANKLLKQVNQSNIETVVNQLS